MTTETHYCLMVDWALGGQRGSNKYDLGAVSEEEALRQARGRLSGGVWRVEVFSREVPVEWTKVEELRPPVRAVSRSGEEQA